MLSWALVPPNRDTLHGHLERRFHGMMELGFLEEVAELHARGDLDPSLPAVRAVGYRQLWSYLDGEIALDEAVRRGITATRQLAKRQMTWIRSEPGLFWVDPYPAAACEQWVARVRAELARAWAAAGMP
jgi:tRNA dimethylallyltransferase